MENELRALEIEGHELEEEAKSLKKVCTDQKRAIEELSGRGEIAEKIELMRTQV